MRKQDHSSALVPKPDGQLINSAVRGRNCKRPNALKHGVFAETPLIPGEDPREFEKLYAGLIEDYKPASFTLRFALRGLADLMWRMHRLKKFVQTQLSLTTFVPDSPSFDEMCGLGIFIHRLCSDPDLSSDPESCFEEHASKWLRPDKINHLTQKFPRSNYESASEWAKAIRSEIFFVLWPATRGLEPPEPPDPEPWVESLKEEAKEAAREWRTEQTVAGCMIYARELLDYELKETERLNAMIVKQTRHCAELKAWEEAEKARSKT
jgi:hypothetical protein